jgi:Leucine-rich repeat (LRR) protein
VRPLHSLVRLQELAISGYGVLTLSQVTGIETVGELRALKKLSLGSLQITDIAFISDLSDLVTLNINEMPISSVEPLRNLASLTTVRLYMTNVVDISPLLGLLSLTNLNVGSTPARADVLTALEQRGVNVQR